MVIGCSDKFCCLGEDVEEDGMGVMVSHFRQFLPHFCHVCAPQGAVLQPYETLILTSINFPRIQKNSLQPHTEK